MVEKLGKVKKPLAKKFKKGRKLFFIPLIINPFEPEKEILGLYSKYWEQAKEHVKKLEEKLTKVKKIYHELITSTGEKGIQDIEQMNAGSYNIVKDSLGKGASIQPIEDEDILLEFMDWSRCLSVGIQNQNVFSKVYQSFLEAQKRRNEHIAKKIDETLRSNEVGILLMREGHQVQFASDIQLFYVAPPGLDEIRRWFQRRENVAQEEQQKKQKENK
jgi:hypothetical protein